MTAPQRSTGLTIALLPVVAVVCANLAVLHAYAVIAFDMSRTGLEAPSKMQVLNAIVVTIETSVACVGAADVLWRLVNHVWWMLVVLIPGTLLVIYATRMIPGPTESAPGGSIITYQYIIIESLVSIFWWFPAVCAVVVRVRGLRPPE